MIDVRSEYDKGKLLFRWDPDTSEVSIVLKDTLYRIRLERDAVSAYKIIEKKPKAS